MNPDEFSANAELKLGANRGKPRVWIEGATLSKAGFAPGDKFRATFGNDSVTIELAPDGDRTISKKARTDGQPHPIIDINTAQLAKAFPDTQRIAVSFSLKKIVITAARAALAAVGLMLGLASAPKADARPLLISLCDYSGKWSAPYVQAGYRVIRVDLGHPPGETIADDGATLIGADVRTWQPPEQPDAVLAAPPCTTFCRPGSRWWARQDAAGETQRDIEIMRASLRIAKTAKKWWALENPPGRHRALIPELGAPSWQFQPYEYGDPWGKQTYIWGTVAKPPITAPVKPPPTVRTPNGKTQGVIARMSSEWKRVREMTPPGFAAAFAQCNH